MTTSTCVRAGLLDDVARALTERFDTPAVVTGASRSLYSTSHTIVDLEVAVGGEPRRLVLKDLSPAGLLPEARGRRPKLLDDPGREVTVYCSVLGGRDLGTAECLASRSDTAAGEHWLVLEKVRGVELYQVGELETWAHAARRLAVLHGRLAEVAEAPPLGLSEHDAGFYAGWWRRAAAFAADAEPGRRRAVEWLAGRHQGVVEELADLPMTVVHGDCSASNVLVDAATGRVCPIDWEMAGVGAALLDLAALTAGWAEAEAAHLSAAYRLALGTDGPEPAAFATALDRCRLQLHVQWLGWSPGWTPPPEHRQDSLAEALALAERLGL